MITTQDLETLERLYTPFAKILLEHLCVDHDYVTTLENPLIRINKQQAKKIRILLTANGLLKDEIGDLTSELNS